LSRHQFQEAISLLADMGANAFVFHTNFFLERASYGVVKD
jgi:hypothetical protein